MPHPGDVRTPCHKQTPRELSAPRHHAPHQSLSIPMTSRLRDTNSARAQRSPPPCSAPVPLHLDDVTTPCHKQTPRELSAPRHHAPHQALSIPMTSRLRATNKLRESSALPVTMLRTSPSPSRWRHDSVPQTNSSRAQPSPPPCSAPVPLHPDDVTTPCHKQTPRTRVPNISPLTRGKKCLVPDAFYVVVKPRWCSRVFSPDHDMLTVFFGTSEPRQLFALRDIVPVFLMEITKIELWLEWQKDIGTPGGISVQM